MADVDKAPFTFRDALDIRDRWFGPDWRPRQPDPQGWPKFADDELRQQHQARVAEWALVEASRASAEDLLDDASLLPCELLARWRLHGTQIARLDAKMRKLNAGWVIA